MHTGHSSNSTDRPLGGSPLARSATLVLVAIAAAALTFVMMRNQFAAVWRTGVFFDTDDAMHLVQARAFLGGQGWYDMTVAALDPPIGTIMHWSHILDLPLVLLIKLFTLATDMATAERLARLTFPFVFLVGLYLGMARLAALLLGDEARILALVATLLSGAGVIQFLPGRIDHHAPQIVILVAMLGAVVGGLERGHAWQASLAGLLAGLSLDINLENLPFIFAIAATLVALWVVEGEALGAVVGWLAAGLIVGLPLSFAAIVPPAAYGATVCDAFGAVHLGAGVIGAIGCGCAVISGSRLRTRARRAAVAAGVGCAMLAFIALAYPVCLQGPFVGVDPLVRDLWLSHVEESLPFTTLLRHDPAAALFAIVPVVLGFIGCVLAAIQTSARRRGGFVIVATVVGVGLALAFWQNRVFSSITAIALCGGIYAALATQRFWRQRDRDALASLSLIILFPFTATAVSLVLPAQAATNIAAPAPRKAATVEQCLAPAAFAPLRDWTGRVIAPLDAGSYLLVHTDLEVFAAAFHRDNDGNHFVLDTMLSSPAQAAAEAAARHVTYIIVCDGLPETQIIADRAPDSLAAALLAHRTPAWLHEIPLPGSPLRVFEVQSRPG